MDKPTSLGRELLKALGAIFACAVLGYLLLTAAYALSDTERQAKNCRASLPVINEEKEYEPELYSRRLLDNVTDWIMIRTAAYNSEDSAFLLAEEAIHTLHESGSCKTDFQLTFEEGAAPGRIEPYRRYWHGYQLTLRPLLHVLSYGQIRVLNSAVQMLLLTVAILLMLKRQPRCLFPFSLMILLLAPTAIGRSLQFSSVYYIMLTAIILLLWNPSGRYTGWALPRLFLLAGIITAFLDFLTAPTITLTAPLVLVCADRKRYAAEQGWKRLLLCCAFWGMGYAGMWGSKWILSLLVTRGQFLRELMETVRFRTSTGDGQESFTRAEALMCNVRELFFNKFHILLCVAYTLAVPLVWHDCLPTARPAQSLPLALPFACGIAWIALLSNHSYIHFFFTYRTLAPCVFAVLTAITPCFKLKEEPS